MKTRRHTRRSRDGGFTLVELLIAVVILGALATVVVFSVGGIIGSGEDNTVDTDGRTLATALEAYYLETGAYGSEADLVSTGFLREQSTLHDVTLNDDGTYTLVPLLGSDADGSGGSGSGGSGSGGSSVGSNTIDGDVVDATDDTPIASADVCVAGTAICTTTDGAGAYSLSGVADGNITIEVTATGFTTLQETVAVTDGEIAIQNVALSPDLGVGELRIVLEWGENPSDLDSHLWLPASNQYHVYYSNTGSLGSFPNAALDVDDTDGFGPETITIPDQISGTYTYGVHNIDGSGGGTTLTDSGAVVRVYDEDGLVQSFTVPAGSGDWWHVFSFNGDTGTISAVNSVSASSPAPYND